ncbi:MAG: F0F1 ATP synthase subunit delta [Eggerthellaceae bacterium]|nr:F0F1 ATP synthase subunit delta [Eggerthellaceae bacterium]
MPTNRLIVKKEVAAYAGVLLDGLYEAGGQERVLEGREQLEGIARYLRTSTELSDVLADATYTPQQHRAIVEGSFTQLGLDPLMVGFLGVMAQEGDIELLPLVSASLKEQLESKLGITVVDVVTAVPLDDGLRQLISNKAATDLGTKIILREQVDKSILGGIIMSAQGRRIDASVFSQLESARNVLKLSTDGGESS